MGKRSSAEQRLTGLDIEKRRIAYCGHQWTCQGGPVTSRADEEPNCAKRTPSTSLSANDDWLPEINVLPFFSCFLGWRAGGWAGGRGWRMGDLENAPLGGRRFATNMQRADSAEPSLQSMMSNLDSISDQCEVAGWNPGGPVLLTYASSTGAGKEHGADDQCAHRCAGRLPKP